MSSRFIPIQAGTDPSQQLAMINKNFAEIDNEGTTKVFNDANGVPTIIMGVLPDKTTGIVISKPGINVLTLF